jgi:hypothetical protein
VSHELRIGRALAAFGVATLAAGCFAPDFPACTVRCGAEERCPSDSACGADGYCHAEGDPGSCAVCLPITCADVAGRCGQHPDDGCGEPLDCGACDGDPTDAGDPADAGDEIDAGEIDAGDTVARSMWMSSTSSSPRRSP